jgi:hypothetical protein
MNDNFKLSRSYSTIIKPTIIYHTEKTIQNNKIQHLNISPNQTNKEKEKHNLSLYIQLNNPRNQEFHFHRTQNIISLKIIKQNCIK